MASVFRNVRVTGDLTVEGTTTSINSENVLIADNSLVLNSGNTSVGASTGSIVVNVNTIASYTIDAGGFLAGGATLNVTGASISAGDFIEISGAVLSANNGLYEVLSYVNPLITIGPQTVNNDFTQTSFTVDTSDAVARVSTISVAVIRAKTSGVFEVGTGSTSSLVFSDISTAAGLGGAVLLAGRSGGQTIEGSTLTAEDLTLRANAVDLTSGQVLFPDTTNATTSTDGAVAVSGGLSVGLNAFVAQTLFADTIDATAVDSEMFIGSNLAAAGVGINIGNNAAFAGAVNIATASTDVSALNIGNVGQASMVLSSTVLQLNAATVNTAATTTIGGATTTTLNLGGSSVTAMTVGNSGSTVSVAGQATFALAPRYTVATVATTTSTPTIAALPAVVRLTNAAATSYTLPASGAGLDGSVITIISGSSSVKTITSADGATAIDGNVNILLSALNDRVSLMYFNDITRWVVV